LRFAARTSATPVKLIKRAGSGGTPPARGKLFPAM
jgi:hypothetical protein